MKTKIIANYLPQYHRIPENDMWWGEGYTDWEAVKRSRSLYIGHNQPRIPQNGYYDLSRTDTLKWQAELAKKYGIYGFGIYHYWFSSKQNLLTKPAVNLLNDSSIDIHFMFIWDNGSWKRTWSNVTPFSNDWAPLYENKTQTVEGDGLLAKLDYGFEEEWKAHFNYLLPFFKDERYIRLNGKPVFAFFNQDNDSETIVKMCEYWDKLAMQNGLNGISFIGKKKRRKPKVLEYEFTYEPEWSAWTHNSLFGRAVEKTKYTLEKKSHVVHKYSYKRAWKKIIDKALRNDDLKEFDGAFVRYDDTPRRGENGRVIIGEAPELFHKYINELQEVCSKKNKEFIFLTAWNEWGEGAYLEPDTVDDCKYLDAIGSIKGN